VRRPEDFLDCPLTVDHEDLLQENSFLVELAQPTLDHLVDDALRLARLTRLLSENARSRDTASGSRRSTSTASGLAAATCMAICRRARPAFQAHRWIGSATSTPILPSLGAIAAWM
jgi:hypothetical protein